MSLWLSFQPATWKYVRFSPLRSSLHGMAQYQGNTISIKCDGRRLGRTFHRSGTVKGQKLHFDLLIDMSGACTFLGPWTKLRAFILQWLTFTINYTNYSQSWIENLEKKLLDISVSMFTKFKNWRKPLLNVSYTTLWTKILGKMNSKK